MCRVARPLRSLGVQRGDRVGVYMGMVPEVAVAMLACARSLRAPLASVGSLSNPWVLAAWAGTVGMQVAAVYVPFLQEALHTAPLGPEHWALMLVVAVPLFVLAESFKRWRWRRERLPPAAAG